MAREVCPTFPGASHALHWGFHDPATIADADERAHAFEQTAQRLRSRIRYFLASRAAPGAADTQPNLTSEEIND
jgi:arsenate reductase (thioredoxin)